jgi:predicted O-linked N-acetylglucosamine transferase (SPINDLY family)
MSKANIIKELTSQLNQMNFICSYHPKTDIYSNMFFDCQNSDEEPAKINLILSVSIDEKKKQFEYYHRISEYTMTKTKRNTQLSAPLTEFHQFVSYQTVTGKTKHIYLDPEEITDFFKKHAQKYSYAFVRSEDQDKSQKKNFFKAKRSAKESVPVLTIITLIVLSLLSLLFQLTPRDWIVSLVLSIIFILSTQMLPKWKWSLTAIWISIQTIIWLIY